MERTTANFEVGVPVSRGVIGLCGDCKTVESVCAFAHVFSIELAFGGVHFKGCGVALRQGFSFIGHNGSHVHCVSGAPYAALSVDKGFEAFLDNFSAGVKTAE